jgi:(p)ppGpp synthase/HD superfamily hydrolase
MLEKALLFASKAHEVQKRKYTGEDYIVHPIAVMEILKSLNLHESILCAALLHDTVEDTTTTVQDIEENFGVQVARIVSDLTDVYTSKAYPNINRRLRKNLECYRMLKMSSTAKTIKLADLIDNTKSILEHDPNFAEVYIKEKEELLFVLEGGNQALMDMAVKSMLNAKKKLGDARK